MAKILVCEDDADQRELLTAFLHHFGHQTMEAGDGEAALAAARNEHPDLILTDWMLPKLNGLALCRAVKADPSTSRTRVVLCTAAAETVLQASKEAGVDGLLAMP